MKNGPRTWERSEVDFLLAHHASMDDAEIGKALGRTEKSVMHKRHILGLKHQNQKAWTTKDVKFLADNRKTMSVDEIAKHLGRKRRTVTSYMYRNGLQPVIQPELYSVYRRKTGEPVAINETMEECCRRMGISINSFHPIKTRFRNGGKTKWEIYHDTAD